LGWFFMKEDAAVADFGTQRLNMVESQVRPSDVTDRHLMRAMRDLPREQFLPDWARAVAYADEDVPVERVAPGKAARCLLAPRTLAKLIQAAEVKEGDRVLDIACATGYSTAVLAALGAAVTALESDAALAGMANHCLAAALIANATIVTGPLAQGWSQGAPYDAIIVNGAVPEVPQPLLAQLKDGGRFVAIVTGGVAGAGLGSAWVYVRRGASFGSRAMFDAGAPVLPGFARLAGFAF
jgi:protein-L-isoaspartate(D-aspartate) O-methyltransferase